MRTDDTTSRPTVRFGYRDKSLGVANFWIANSRLTDGTGSGQENWVQLLHDTGNRVNVLDHKFGDPNQCGAIGSLAPDRYIISEATIVVD